MDHNTVDDTPSEEIPGWDRVQAAGEVPTVRPEVLTRAQAVLRSRVQQEYTAALAPTPTPTPHRRWKRFAAAGLVAAALAGIAVLAPTAGLPGHSPAATASAATFFREVATRVPSTDLSATTPFWRMDYAVTTQQPEGSLATTRIQQWNGPVSSYLRLDDGPVTREGATPYLGALSWEQLRALPADIPGLSAALDAAIAAGEDRSRSQYSVIIELLAAPVTPSVRRALFELAAQTEGVTLIGAATDSTGRPGTALETTSTLSGATTTRDVLTADGALLESILTNGPVLVERTTWYDLYPARSPPPARHQQ